MRNLFTSEAVTEGHPDKIADQLSDAVLDAILLQDKNARVACEVLVTTGLVVVSGEITTDAYVDIQKIVRQKIKQIGYTNAAYGLDGDTCGVIVTIDEQSPDINRGVDRNDGEIGAGDQGIMFGYATNETETYMPITYFYAQKLAQKLAQVRHDKSIKYLRPDGKTQVTFEFDDENKPLRVDAIVISTQHDAGITQETIEADLKKHVIDPVFNGMFLDENTHYYINPTGQFIIGGPQGDVGLTGRKIIVDSYGGSARHGGGAFSGKDYTKVDRSGAYVARYIAKNVVAAGLCDRCEVQLSYAIGIAEPTSIRVDTFGTEHIAKSEIEKRISENFVLTPARIIESLDLQRPIYSATSVYGHFGREEESFTWEKLDKVDALKKGV